MKTMQAKGINFRSFLAALRRLKGDDAVARTLDFLPPELAEPLRVGAITTGGWYPVEWYAQLHAAAQRACSAGVELSRSVGRDSVRDDFKAGAYRLITVTVAPEALAKWAPKVMALYYDAGRIVIEQAEPGRAMGRFEGYHGFDRNLWEDLIGGTCGIVELAGAKSVTPRVLAGGGDGDDHMSYAIRWTV